MSGYANRGPTSLWRWISIRMIGLALLVILIIGVGMWYRFQFWESSHRRTLPLDVQAELQALEARRASDPDADLPRLKQIYGEYLYGEYFAPRVVREDFVVIFSLILISLPLVVVGGVWVSLRMSRQLGAVAVAAERIAEGAFDARAGINADAPQALRSLALDFNRMAERLERYDQELMISSAAIAHELRTPLTAAKSRLKALLDGVFEPSPDNLRIIMRQLDQINRLTDDLYLLSLASAGRAETRCQPVSASGSGRGSLRMGARPVRSSCDAPGDRRSRRTVCACGPGSAWSGSVDPHRQRDPVWVGRQVVAGLWAPGGPVAEPESGGCRSGVSAGVRQPGLRPLLAGGNLSRSQSGWRWSGSFGSRCNLSGSWRLAHCTQQARGRSRYRHQDSGRRRRLHQTLI